MLRPAENEIPFGRPGGGPFRRSFRWSTPRRGEVTGQGAHLFVPRFFGPVGAEKPASRAMEYFQFPPRQGRKYSGISAFQLDRSGPLATCPRGASTDRASRTCPLT